MLVGIDVVGDIDSKPVLSWRGLDGSQRHTFTRVWHARRARMLASSSRGALEKVMAAHTLAAKEFADGLHKSPVLAAACTVLESGAPPSALCKLLGAHAIVHGAAVVEKSQWEGEAVVMAQSGNMALAFEGPWRMEDAIYMALIDGHDPTSFAWRAKRVVEKSNMGYPHPDAVSIIGDRAVFSFCHKGIADYCMAHPSPAEPLFDVSPEEVQAKLDELGLEGVTHDVIRHVAAAMSAADAFSKLPPADLSVKGAFPTFLANIEEASASVKRRMGLQGMSHALTPIPPGVLLAYAHASNGAAIWGKAFEGFPWSSQKPQKASSAPSSPVTKADISQMAPAHALTGQATSPTCMGSPSQQPSLPTQSWMQNPKNQSAEPYDVGGLVDGGVVVAKMQGMPIVLKGQALFGGVATSGGPLSLQSLGAVEALGIIDKLKARPNWGVVKLLLKIPSLARKARQGDAVAAASLRELQKLLAGASTLLEQALLPATAGPVAKGLRGPEGLPIGATRVHADGSVWEKRSDGWHRASQGKDAPQDDEPEQEAWRNSPSYKTSTQALARLRQTLRNTTDKEERKLIIAQISRVKERLAALQEAARVQEGRTSGKPDVEKALGFDAAVFPRAATYLAAMSPAQALQAAVELDDILGFIELKAVTLANRT